MYLYIVNCIIMRTVGVHIGIIWIVASAARNAYTYVYTLTRSRILGACIERRIDCTRVSVYSHAYEARCSLRAQLESKQ